MGDCLEQKDVQVLGLQVFKASASFYSSPAMVYRRREADSIHFHLMLSASGRMGHSFRGLTVECSLRATI